MNPNNIDELKADGYRPACSMTNSQFGVVILIKSEHDDLTQEEKRPFMRAADSVYNGLENIALSRDPEVQERHQKQREDLLACFSDCGTIFVQDVPNEYCPKPCCPSWHIVTTSIGHIKVGWRKRVIVIDWHETTNEEKADTLFADEDVTKDARMIHAWGCDKAREYINKLHEAAQT